MTRLRTGGFTFVPARSRKRRSVGRFGALKIACIFLFVLCIAIAAPTKTTFTTLHSFNGADGADPYAGLVQANNGNFYGTTYVGGSRKGGTVFEITPGGTLATLYNFRAYPYSGLVQATNGELYGTTTAGGANLFGMVFEISDGGTFKSLHSFCFQTGCPDGASPLAGLIQATDGNFYGTTPGYGINGTGTVFEVTASGKLTTLHSFDGTDGSDPLGHLVQGTDGNIYGTTRFGGSSTACSGGCGTVFKITSGGTLTTLHSFNGTDGAEPYAQLVQATNGNFYGTANSGGANGYGTVFKITAAGTLTTLYSFAGTDGANPTAGLVQGTNGNFYGTTFSGGANNYGTIFKITAAGVFTMLHSFDGTDGANPFTEGLIQATDGSFYGTTAGGGTDSNGTIFRLSVGLGPFVKTQPTSGTVGGAVIILGNNLTGSTAVTFNGIQATFTVVSSSEITATVPAGATTGLVKVTTPSGTLKSNVVFRVPK